MAAGEHETGIVAATEHAIEVPRSARYYTLGAAGSHVRQVWIACHGYGQLAASFLRGFETIARPDRLIIAPEALNRYYTNGGIGPHGPGAPVGATWMTREHRLAEIEDYLRYLDLLYVKALRGVDRGRATIHALGFSQGGATIARWAARTAYKLDHVVLWGATMPPELEPSRRLFAGADLTMVFGTHDQFASAERIRTEEDRLRAGSVPFRIVRFEGGHRLDRETLTTLAREPAK